MMFFLAVLGVGIFSYYQGRSCDPVLLGVCYPSFIILALLTDRLVTVIIQEKKLLYYVPLVASVFVMIFSLALLGGHYQPLLDSLTKKNLFAGSSSYSQMQMKVDFVKSHTKPSEKVLFLSLHSGIYHLYSGTTSPLLLSGPSEWLLCDEIEIAYNYIVGGKWEKIFVDDTNLVTENPWVGELHSTLANSYKPSDVSPDGSLKFYYRGETSTMSGKFMIERGNVN